MEEFIKILNEIPRISAQLDELIKIQREGTIEKKWLGIEEVVNYIPYSKDKVYKLVQEEWIEGVHYFKPTGRLIFKKEKIDEWVRVGSSKPASKIIDDIFVSITRT